MVTHLHSLELGESLFEIVKLECIWPVVLVWSTKNLEDFEDLVNFGVTHEKWLTLHHFRKDASC